MWHLRLALTIAEVSLILMLSFRLNLVERVDQAYNLVLYLLMHLRLQRLYAHLWTDYALCVLQATHVHLVAISGPSERTIWRALIPY